MAITAAAGLCLRLVKPEGQFSRRDGFAIVGIGWILVCALGALPYVFSGVIPSYAGAYFETMSGFTTTGATVLGKIEGLSRGILFWRSLTHWLGGMGIIVLSLAIFSIFRTGASMFQAEVPGITSERILPKLKHTALMLWVIYAILSLVETVALMFSGMSLFESLVHTFGTMATGGFSSRNISVEAFHSVPIEIIIAIFMILAGMNFSLFYKVVQKRSLGALFGDPETKGYLAVIGIATILITITLVPALKLPLSEALRQAFFQVSSIITTTGFSSANFDLWPSFSKGILLLLMFIGGCTGSTGGAIKVARIILLFKYTWKQILRIARPRLVIQNKLGSVPIPDAVVHETLAFFFVYILLFVIGSLVVMATGADLVTSLSATAATLGNVGPGFALVGPYGNYGVLSPVAQWTLSFMMLAGRLEIFTVLVMFAPSFWRK
jgi:trk system potassium uptake protein TrkH